MIYLTGQLLAFLIVTGSVGFILGWILRGAILSTSAIHSAKVLYSAETQTDNTNYFISGMASEKRAPRRLTLPTCHCTRTRTLPSCTFQVGGTQ